MRLKKVCEKFILIIVTLSLLLIFIVAPSSYAKLTLSDSEFYYAGTTKGTYTASEGIFSWLLDNLSQIADWLVGIMTMGPRMVFVGWTALIERILTWTLETTTGVNMNGDGVDSSTDLSSITDSSSNVTVQAIVYNQVPAFDINFFDIEYDPTVSGTGHIYTCDKCNKECSDAECCGTSSDSCKCACNGQCDGCQAYMAALEVQDQVDEVPPVVIQLKTLVSGWYYVLRLLSLAAMLIVLIGIGIKMAISTIASEKAVYKRMLVDWLVGLIVLVSIHYIMWFIIQINDTLVEVIKDSANSINQVQLKQLYDKNDSKGEKNEISNEEIEINVYEEIRTRAYDPKLSVGLSGMIMYMTLVYFAIRYSLVYIKRFLTLVVLTLMGPPVGVAYALQKAISGKSSTFKAWLTEYVMNVIIQSVHALIYAVFISEALVLSLQSVAGIIVALIFMNFALKAEKLFKQIFKMSSEGSLLESAEQAGDAEKIKSNFQAARGLYMGAKPVAGALMNTPLAKTVKGAGKVGLAGAGVALGAAYSRLKGNGDSDSEKMEDNDSQENTLQDGSNKSNSSNSSNVAYSSEDEQLSAEDEEKVVGSTKQLVIKGGDALKADVVAKMDAYDNAPENKEKEAAEELSVAIDAYKKHEELSLPSLGTIAKGHIERIVDVDNHFKTSTKDGGEKITFSSFMKGALGSEHYDSKSGKWVSDGNAYYQKFTPTNLLGFTDADKKVFKEHVLGPILNGGFGMLTTFAGFGLMVAHPSLGMGMIASGTIAQRKAFKRPTNDKKYKGKYTFSRFSVPAMNTIQKEVAARTDREIDSLLKNADSQMLQRIEKDHPELYNSLKQNVNKDMMSERSVDGLVKDLEIGGATAVAATAKAVTLGIVSGSGVVTAVPTATAFAMGFGARKFVASSGIGSHIEAIQKHAAKQAKEQQLGFMQDGLNAEAGITKGFMAKKVDDQEQENMKKLFEELGYEYNPITGEPIEKSDDKKAQEHYNKEMIALYAAQGIKYDPVKQTFTLIPQEEVEKNKNKDSFVDTPNTKDEKHKFTSQDNETLNKEINAVIEELIKQKNGNLDMTSQKVQDDAIRSLSEKLIHANVITKDQHIEDVFKGGKDKLVQSLKQKSDSGNAEYALKNSLTEEEINKVKEETVKVAVKNGNDYSKVKVEDILNKVNLLDKSKPVASKDENDYGDDRKRAIPQVPDKSQAVVDYLQHMQKIQPKAPAKSQPIVSVQEAKDIVNKKMRSRKKKLQQILDLDIQIDNEAESTTDTAINMAFEIKNGSKKTTFKSKDGSTIHLEQNEASDVLELLLMRKEMEQINEFAEKELEIKKGSKAYNNKLKSKSQSAIDYYRAQLEIETMKQADPSLSYTKEKIASIKDASERTLIEKKQEKLLKNINELQKLEKKKIEYENSMASKGPIMDVDEFIAETFNKRKK